MVEAKELSKALLEEPKHLSSLDEASIPQYPGYYAIFISSPESFPEPFRGALSSRNTCLVYIGIATVSLRKRLWEQDIKHKSPSTFFRGIAPILGFRPQVGSLVKKGNQNNYFFSEDDTAKITKWMKEYLLINWLQESSANKRTEGEVIKQNEPLLNTYHNPSKLAALALLRAECRAIATTT